MDRLLHNRVVGVDVAKALAMFLVVLLHVSGIGSARIGHSLTSSISYCCIDVFALASGYLGLNATWRFSKIVKLWLQTIFWGVAVLFACKVFGYRVGLKDVINACLPITRYAYWYFTSYALLFFFMPLLNAAIRNATRKALQICLVAVFIMACVTSLFEGDICYFGKGYSFAWLVVLYICGGYLQLYRPIRWKSWYCFLVALSSALLGYVVGLIFDAIGFHHQGDNARMAVSYVSPFTIIEAIFIFVGCLQLKIDSVRTARFWTRLSVATFGVYLIHVQPFFFRKVWPELLDRIFADLGWEVIPVEIVIAVVVYMGCTFLEWLRLRLFAFFYKVFCQTK